MLTFLIFNLMMKNKFKLLKKIVLIGLLLLISHVSQGQAITFQKAYGIDGVMNFVNNWLLTKDGGYLLCGLTYPGDIAPNGWLNGNSYVYKTNYKGEVEWKRMYQITDSLGQRNNDELFSAVETPDGGYAMVGSRTVDNNLPSTNLDVLLIKTDGSGNPQWTKCYGGSKHDYGYDIKLANDGGFIITGQTNSYSSDIKDYDLYLLKTDSNGKLEWTKTYGDATISKGASDGGSAIYNTTDGYLIMGTNLTQGSGGAERRFPYLLKTDNNGNAFSAFAFKPEATTITSFGSDVKMTPDGGYIIAARGQNSGSGDFFSCLIKLKSDFSTEWTKKYSDGTFAGTYGVTLCNDGGYAIMGYTKKWGHPSNSNNDIFIIKTKKDGSVKWAKSYGGVEDEHIATSGIKSKVNIFQTADKGYATAMVSNSWGDTKYTSMYLIKADSLGNSGCNDSIISGNIESSITSVLMQRSNQPVTSNKGITHLVNTTVDYETGREIPLCTTADINEAEVLKHELRIYPNPANEVINVSFRFQVSGFRSEISIYDITGKLIKQMSANSELLKTIDISGLNKGLYFISVINKDKIINAKFVKE